MGMAATIEAVLDAFVDRHGDELSLLLLKTLAYPSQGGDGYRIEIGELTLDMDHWDVDRDGKLIRLDLTGWFSERSAEDLSDVLKDALEVGVLERRLSLAARIGWGSAKLVLGLVETAVGVVGIIVPVPGTTVAGVAVTVLGVSTIGEALSQFAGTNNGNGTNVLEESIAWTTSRAFELGGGDAELGDQLGRIGFTVTSIAVGSVGMLRILRVPGTAASRWITVGVPHSGRVGVAIPSMNTAGGGMTVFSINNNAGQSILRFVTQNGALHVNGRIIGVSNVLRHEHDWRVVCKGLLKLLWHGAKAGM
jgi:hypothetical protein